jgi:hypothetical protein
MLSKTMRLFNSACAGDFMKSCRFKYFLVAFCALLMNNAAWSHGHGGGGFGGHAGGFGGHHGGGYGGHYGGFALGYGLGYSLGYSPYWGYGGYGRYGYGYAYPPVITVPSTPPVYIQRTIVPPPEPNYWYYCRSAAGYYPYVRECPGGWEKVAPQPSVR